VSRAAEDRQAVDDTDAVNRLEVYSGRAQGMLRHAQACSGSAQVLLRPEAVTGTG
jgi:hypothetical protein